MDLSQALRDAADTGTSHRQPIAAGPVLRRIHRRRAARVAVESTVGVAAAGAVAIGALQVTAMRTPDPAPLAPAISTPTPTQEPVTPPTPTPTQEPVTPPTPTPTPTPTQEPVTPPDDAGPALGAHPDLDELVLSPAGLGPLAVGVPVGDNPGAAMIELDPDFCDTELSPDTEPGRWVASGYPTEDLFGQVRPPFFVDADDDAVHRIDVLGPTIGTAEGIRNGSTVAELQAAYPRLEGPFAEHDLSRVWWLTGPTGTLVFETQSRDAEGQLAPDQPERVILMRVLAAGADPRFQSANSGDIAGSCG